MNCTKPAAFLGILVLFFLAACDSPSLSETGTNDANNGCQGASCDGDHDGDGDRDNPNNPTNQLPENTAPGSNPCGPDQYCSWHGFGGAQGSGFDQGDMSGAMLDEDGALTLEDGTSREFFIWIANTGQGTISKFNTETQEEVARYRTGPEANPDPSRTSVNSDGDVFVGNRGGQSVTKIGLAPDNCVSQAGDGAINTSSGPNDVRAWGEDDCILWHTSLAGTGVVRAVAAQDTNEGSYVWVGGWNHTIYKLDGETGDILLQTSSPVRPYGFALDEAGNLWVATYPDALMARIDTNVCKDNASCDVTVCGNDGDDCVKQLINAPGTGYGITVDHRQRVWLGGSVMRYDPFAEPAERWVHVNYPGFIHGIAADAQGWIYGAGWGLGIVRFDGDEPSQSTSMAGTTNRSVKGVAVDHHDHVWGINLSHNDAFVVAPGAGLNDSELVAQPTGLVNPYTYSDMTGTQLRFATEQVGVWRHVFEGCHPNSHVFNEWRQLRFTASAPGGSQIQWRVRAADFPEHLSSAPFIELGMSPQLNSPVDLYSALKAHNLERSRLLQVEVRLRPEVQDEVLHVPRVEAVDIVAECPPIHQ